MKKSFLLLAGLILLAFTACQNDELMLLLPARRATVHR